MIIEEEEGGMIIEEEEGGNLFCLKLIQCIYSYNLWVQVIIITYYSLGCNDDLYP